MKVEVSEVRGKDKIKKMKRSLIKKLINLVLSDPQEFTKQHSIKRELFSNWQRYFAYYQLSSFSYDRLLANPAGSSVR